MTRGLKQNRAIPPNPHNKAPSTSSIFASLRFFPHLFDHITITQARLPGRPSPHQGSGGGSIINISSVLGLAAEPSFPATAYASAKAGVANLTPQLAVEWARDGIRVNAIAPGIFKTDIGGESDKPLWGEAFQAHVNDRMPLQRIGMPDELKGTAIFLAFEASCLVMGHILPVDGGWLAW